MRRSLVALAVSAGCGRLDFDATTDGRALDDMAISIACPADYLPVRGNAQLGTQNFCVMQTEARAWGDTNTDGTFETTELDDDGCDTPACDVDWTTPGYLPVSPLPVLAEPWRKVSAAVAKNVCRALGPQFDLMSNREWMTIARSAELIGANWSGGAPGSGRLIEGHTESTSFNLPISDPADPYTGTGNDASQLPDVGWEQRRTLVIAAGVEIWDLPGHVQEWVDWIAGDPLEGVPQACGSGELPVFSCPGLVDADFQSSTGTYDSSSGAGRVIGGTGDAVRRGGQTTDRTLGIAGIYGFNMNRNQTDSFPGTGFRCVFRP